MYKYTSINNRNIYTIVLICIFIILSVSPIFALRLSVKNGSLYASNDSIYLKGHIQPDYPEQFFNVIETGTIATQRIRLVLQERALSGKKVSSYVFTRTIQYDEWSHLYIIIENHNTIRESTHVFKHRNEMSEYLRSLNAIWICSRRLINKHINYEVVIRAEITSIVFLPPIGWILNSLYNFSSNPIVIEQFTGNKYSYE